MKELPVPLPKTRTLADFVLEFLQKFDELEFLGSRGWREWKNMQPISTEPFGHGHRFQFDQYRRKQDRLSDMFIADRSKEPDC
jgi:hypothetical protein